MKKKSFMHFQAIKKKTMGYLLINQVLNINFNSSMLEVGQSFLSGIKTFNLQNDIKLKKNLLFTIYLDFDTITYKNVEKYIIT